MPARSTPCAASPLAANLLAALRRSLLGAWLAVAYALTVLAAGLAPAPALAAGTGPAGAVLCSGIPLPGPEMPAPVGELAHCKGCPLNPVLGAPVCAQAAIDAEGVRPIALLRPAAEGLPRGMVAGLPGSRGPPVSVAHA